MRLVLGLLLVLLPLAAAAQECGDANGDGNLSVSDGVQILRASAGLASDCTAARCDVNANGSITVTDGVAVLRAAAGLAGALTCPGGAQIEMRALGTSRLSPGVAGPPIVVDAQGASSVTLMATTTDFLPSLFFFAVELPGGPADVSFIGQPPTIRSAPGAGQITLTLPNTPAIPYADGAYTFRIQSTQPTTVEFHAAINRRPAGTTGRLDLRMFVVDPATDAPPDPNDPALAAIRDGVDRKLAGAGIRLGTVTFGVVPTEIEQDTFVIDPDLDLNRNGTADQAELLFAVTPRDTSVRVLDVFVVREFLGSAIVGFSGGIPGPTMAPATRSSGVVVAAFNGFDGNRLDTEAIAHITAHEVGHYLGLFHTTENPAAIDASDPLADTAICPAATFQAAIDTCPDAANLMFPFLLSLVEQNALTPDQGFVLQRNPLIVD